MTVAENDDRGLASELDFMQAMAAYRAAKREGDANEVQAAEEALRNVVRNELQES